MQRIIFRQDSKQLNRVNNISVFSGEKDVDFLEFLIPLEYNGVDLSDCNVRMSYVTGNGFEHSFLIDEYKKEELYENEYFIYLVPVSPRFTSVEGTVNAYLSITKTVDGEEQKILKTGDVEILIRDHLSDSSQLDEEDIEIIDQVVLKAQWAVDEVERIEHIVDDKVDKSTTVAGISLENNIDADDLAGNVLTVYATRSVEDRDFYTKDEVDQKIITDTSKVYPAVYKNGELSYDPEDYPNIKYDDLVVDLAKTQILYVESLSDDFVYLTPLNELETFNGEPLEYTRGRQYKIGTMYLSNNGILYYCENAVFEETQGGEMWHWTWRKYCDDVVREIKTTGQDTASNIAIDVSNYAIFQATTTAGQDTGVRLAMYDENDDLIENNIPIIVNNEKVKINISKATTIKLYMESSGLSANVFYRLTNEVVRERELTNELASKQDTIDSSNKLSADLLSDGTTNKPSVWNAKQNALTAGSGIDITSDTVSVKLDNANSILEFVSGKLNVNSAQIPFDIGFQTTMPYDPTIRQRLADASIQNALASKSYVDEKLSGKLKKLIVTELPTEDIDKDTIYMILRSAPTTNNIYDEYLYVLKSTNPDVYDWELIGSTEVDLSNYYTKTESDNKYQLIIDSTHKVSADNIDDSESTNKFTDANEKAEWSGKSRVYPAKFVNNEIDLRQASYPNIQQFDLLMDMNNQRFFYCNYLNQIGGIQGHWIEKVKSIIDTPPATVDVSQDPLAELYIDDVLLSDNGNIYRVLTKDLSSLPVIAYTYQTYKGTDTTYSASTGLSLNNGAFSVDNPVPSGTSSDYGKYLKNNNGTLEWSSVSGGGSYSGGDGIDITNDTISVDLKSGTELQITSGELDIDLSNYATTTSVSGKEDKTTISTDTTSTTVSLTLADNHEYRYTQDLTSLTLTMPSGDFIASVVFASGSTPTSMTYDSSIKWSGDDVTNGQFVPSADKDYDIMMYYNGLNINGIVRGV